MNCRILFCKFIILSSVWVCSSWSNDFSDFFGKFKVYWNIPTFMCKRFNISFDGVPSRYKIIQNQNDSFRGEEISILYDVGDVPSIQKNWRNHGVPQRGILSKHVSALKKQIPEQIPDPNYSGLAIIDMQEWRPVFRRNYGSRSAYLNASYDIERKIHRHWSHEQVMREAKRIFEINAKEFMLATLKTAKHLRPHAQWGFFLYPNCYNAFSRNPRSCPEPAKQDNNRLRWLFQCSDLLLPSIYLQESIAESNRVHVVAGRVAEALRVQKMVHNIIKPKVFIYHRYVYKDTLKEIGFVESNEILRAVKQGGADGIILWGSSFDLNTQKKCEDFQDYVRDVLGPGILSLQ